MRRDDRLAPIRYRWARVSPILHPQFVLRRTRLFALDRLGRRAYRTLSEDELRARRRSDTVFVFGSGRSLNDIAPEQWRAIARHDVISLREFPRQQWVRADFHLTGEVDFIEPYAQRLRENPLYAETAFVVQEGWFAESGNELIGRRLLPLGARVYRFRRVSRGGYASPSRSLARGLVHAFNSITDATNFAYLLGWRRIVLAGVDLYNKEYFWLPAGETRTYERPGITASSEFTNARNTVDLFACWRAELEPEGVELFVSNPRSLLADVLPVFDPAAF
jgi:hypothetical protein